MTRSAVNEPSRVRNKVEVLSQRDRFAGSVLFMVRYCGSRTSVPLQTLQGHFFSNRITRYYVWMKNKKTLALSISKNQYSKLMESSLSLGIC